MQDQELMTSGFGEEEDAIIPDGWKDGDDFLADPDTWSGGAEPTDEPVKATTQAEPTETDDAPEADPTTVEADGAEGTSTEPETEEATPGQAETPVTSPRILKLKVNHGKQDREVDINGMTDEELIASLQKAEAFDAMKDRQMKEQYRHIYQDQIDAGMTEAAARMVAANECGGKSYALTDAEEATGPTAEESAPERDFVAEVQQLRALYPEVKEIPDEVALAAADGTNLLTAYLAYKGKQSQQAAATLKRENAVLKHNAASAARAPVRGVTGGGATNTKPDDPFLKGLAEDW